MKWLHHCRVLVHRIQLIVQILFQTFDQSRRNAKKAPDLYDWINGITLKGLLIMSNVHTKALTSSKIPAFDHRRPRHIVRSRSFLWSTYDSLKASLCTEVPSNLHFGFPSV